LFLCPIGDFGGSFVALYTRRVWVNWIKWRIEWRGGTGAISDSYNSVFTLLHTELFGGIW